MKSIKVLFALAFISACSVGHAASDQQLAGIKRLGELNGIALQCHELEQTQRIKRALILILPKRRQLGEWFDYATNDSFMTFISDKGSCPSSSDLAQQVGTAITALKKLYAHH